MWQSMVEFRSVSFRKKEKKEKKLSEFVTENNTIRYDEIILLCAKKLTRLVYRA